MLKKPSKQKINKFQTIITGYSRTMEMLHKRKVKYLCLFRFTRPRNVACVRLDNEYWVQPILKDWGELDFAIVIDT